MKKQIIKILAGLLSILMLVSFAACEVEGPDDTTVTAARTPNPTPKDLRGQIKISGYRSGQYDESLMDFITQVALDYTGLEVEYDDLYTEEEYFANLKANVEKGDIGDIFLVRDTDLPWLVEGGYIVSLTEYEDNFFDYSNSGYERVDIEKEVYPAALHTSHYNGTLYMIPTEYNHKFVFINYTMLKQAGITDVPDDKWTWDEFATYAAAITSVGGTIIMDYTDSSIWGSFIEGAGGTFSQTDKDGFAVQNTPVDIASDAVVSNLNKLVNFVKTNKVVPKLGTMDLSQVGLAVVDHSEMQQWKNTTESEYFDWSLVDFEWDFMHYPRFENHSVGSHTVGFVVRNSDDISDERKELGASVAMYTLFNEPSKLYVGDGEVVPANIDVADMKFWREYPIKGKNTSVFTNYCNSDYAACFTAYMNSNAANQLNRVGSAIEQAKNGADLRGLLQSIQSATNSAMGS